jgi:aminoglycoside phosphotransferase (APT) family kinase protein
VPARTPRTSSARVAVSTLVPAAPACAHGRELSARVVGFRRMTGGIVASVHQLTIEYASGRRDAVVLRQYEHQDTAVEREAGNLSQVADAGLPAPRLLAVCATGAEAGGHPTILMTRLPGRADLAPADPDRWLDQMADLAVNIHDATVTALEYDRWVDPQRLTVPASAARPQLWRAMASTLIAPEPAYRPRFIHRDFQHFNLLWSRGRLTGVVDWGNAGFGPPDLDTGHCRLNLAVLFGAEWAERFRIAYEARAGRRVDPWWDLYALASYNDAWPEFIPIQVNGRARVDMAGMTGRVEELIDATLRRL